MKKIAIIPARGGSKRIPKKNIKPFLGEPMINYAIRKAINIEEFDRIIVTTDSDEIKNVVLNFEEVEIVTRSKKLSDDQTPTQPVIQDVITNIEIEQEDLVACIYPCTPLLREKDLSLGLDLAKKSINEFVFPVVRYGHPIQRSFKINKNNLLTMNNPEFELSPTQSLDENYHDAGQYYIASVKTWMSNKRIHTSARGLVLNKLYAIDIDNEEDWLVAESLYKNLKVEK